jgi:hypothetical protein
MASQLQLHLPSTKGQHRRYISLSYSLLTFMAPLSCSAFFRIHHYEGPIAESVIISEFDGQINASFTFISSQQELIRWFLSKFAEEISFDM